MFQFSNNVEMIINVFVHSLVLGENVMKVVSI